MPDTIFAPNVPRDKNHRDRVSGRNIFYMDQDSMKNIGLQHLYPKGSKESFYTFCLAFKALLLKNKRLINMLLLVTY